MPGTRTTFRPLRWTEPSTPAADRRSISTFKESWSNTLDLLDAELCHLDARDLIIEADFREDDLLSDGMPCTGARPPVHPGVRISFQSRLGPLVYACDSCERWQHNVRSMALGLTVMRRTQAAQLVGRYAEAAPAGPGWAPPMLRRPSHSE